MEYTQSKVSACKYLRYVTLLIQDLHKPKLTFVSQAVVLHFQLYPFHDVLSIVRCLLSLTAMGVRPRVPEA